MRINCSACKLSEVGCCSGEGPQDAKIMVIADRLSEQALKVDTAFADRVGGDIRGYMEAAGLDHKKVYFTNTVKGAVLPKKQVTTVQIEKCSTLLRGEISSIKPKVIVLMGATAYKNFHTKAIAGTIHFDEGYQAWIIYTHHPLKPVISGQVKDANDIVDAFKKAMSLVSEEVKVLAKPPVVIIKTREELEAIIPKIKAFDTWGVDLETTGLNLQKCNCLTIGLSTNSLHYGIILKEGMQPALQEIFDHIKMIGHNFKFDSQYLRKAGVIVKHPFVDTLLAHYMLEPLANTHELASISLQYFHTSFEKEINYEELFSKPITDEVLDMLAIRGCYDAYLSFKVYEKLSADIDKNKDYFFNTLVPISMLIAEMEYNGITIDRDALYKAETTLKYQLKSIEAELLQDPIIAIFKEKEELDEVNFSSPKQMSNLIYKYLKLPAVENRKGKMDSTDKDALEQLQEIHNSPLLTKLMTYRNLSKLADTYIAGIQAALDRSSDDRIHPEYWQTTVITGRFSSSKPNLQTIPKSVENASLIRSMFCARPGYKLMEMDFAQMEVRVWAHMSKDQALIDMCAQGGDMHRIVAAQVYKIPADQITDEQRHAAKEIVFGLTYGMGIKALAMRTGLSIEDAQIVKDKFFSAFPDATMWITQAADFGIKFHYVLTPFGRKIPIVFNQNNSEEVSSARRRAVNYPIQSTAAEFTNRVGVALMHVVKAMPTLDAKLLLNVHDSFIWEVKEGHEQQLKAISLQAIQDLSTKLKFRAKLDAAFKYGKDLYDQVAL